MTELTEQQLKAVLSVDRHVLVSAGAGSGKTHVLVERYVEILKSSPDMAVSHIVAVTFTKKAASEMRTRLKAKFQELLEQCATIERDRWYRCLAEIDAARIGTIHSLCESILKAFPAEAAIDPQFEVIDDLGQAELFAESIDEAFRQVIAQHCPEHDLLLSFQLEQVRRWLITILKASLQFFEAIEPMRAIDWDGFADRAAALLERTRKLLLADLGHDASWREATDRLQRLALSNPSLKLWQSEILSACAAVLNCSSDDLDCAPADSGRRQQNRLECGMQANLELESRWSGLRSLCDITLRKGGNSDEAKALKAELKQIRQLAKERSEQLPPGLWEADEKAFEAMQGLIRLADRTFGIYAEKKNLALRLDYNDLIRLAYNALAQSGSPARRHFNESIKAILVDEFQDTNKMQSMLISLLAGPQAKLFLIGDDKQSIYKFQGADVSTFNDWQQLIGRGAVAPAATSGGGNPPAGGSGPVAADPPAAGNGSDAGDLPAAGTSADGGTGGAGPVSALIDGGGECLSLNMSFRSHPQVLSFINAVFEKILGDDRRSESYCARFEPLRPAREPEGVEDRIEVVLFEGGIQKNGRRDAQVSRIFEAEAVAAWIREKAAAGGQETGFSYGDFAVLVQRNQDFSPIESALASAGVPYVTLGGKSFLERQEVLDIENLLRVLFCPQDDHALLGVLRSPMFALSDDLIHLVKGLAAGKTLWQGLRVAARSGRAGLESCGKVSMQLASFFDAAQRLTLPELLRKIITTTHYDLVLMALPNGRQRARNLWKLVEMAAGCHTLSAGDFARRLSLMREFDVKQSDAPLDTTDAVKLMTIHSSKGLEFPVVILPVLGSPAVGMKGKLLFQREYGLALSTARSIDEEPPGWYKMAAFLDSDMDLAERKRLLYVAMTRAREHLALFVEKDVQDRASFRRWIVRALELENAARHEDEVSAPPGRQDEPSLLPVLPGHQERSFQRRRIGASDGSQAQYIVRTAERSWVTSSFSPPDISITLVEEQSAEVKFDLIEPVQINLKDPPSAWLGWSRITPQSLPAQLHPTVSGTFFHALMEHVSVNAGCLPPNMMRDLAFAQGECVAHPALMQAMLAEADRLLSLYFESELCAMLQSAKRVIHEMPYWKIVEGSASSRRPDLLFEDVCGNWHLVDYKTDHIEAQAVQAQSQRHREQLEEYAVDLQKLANIEAKAWLYFACLGVLHPV